MVDLVECHSEVTYAEQPTALIWQGQRLPVVEVLARWRAPGAMRFRVRTVGGMIFELEYDEVKDIWQIEER